MSPTGHRFTGLPDELLWLAAELRPLWSLHVASFLCLTGASLLGVVTPLVLRSLIDTVIPNHRTGMLAGAVALIFLGYEGKAATIALGNYLMLSAGQKLALKLRLKLLRHLDTLSADYYEATPVGTAMYPFKEPTEEICTFGCELLPLILRTLLTTTFTLGTMIILSPALTLAVVPVLPVFLFARQRFRRKLSDDSDLVQTRRRAWSAFLEEHLSSIISVQLLGQQRRQERKALHLHTVLLRSQEKLFTSAVHFTLCSSLVVVLSMCGVVAYGGSAVLAGRLSIGSLVAFYTFVTELFEPFAGLAELYARAQRTRASVRQVQSVFNVSSAVRDTVGAVRLSHDHPAVVEFVQVEFGYQYRSDVLRVARLTIRAGERVGIAGENGAGKSTLAKLMVRMYDPDRGLIRIGGLDIRCVQLDSLRQFVCYASRDPVLFDGTLESNIRFVRPAASHDEVWKTIRCVGLASLVESVPDGLQQRLGPGGCQLSGGQRQRLALARAVLQSPRILILDEATSCLDPASETVVLDNIQRLLPGCTLIVVSHRTSALAAFERVIVVDSGKIVVDGKPLWLTASQGGQSILPAPGLLQ